MKPRLCMLSIRVVTLYVLVSAGCSTHGMQTRVYVVDDLFWESLVADESAFPQSKYNDEQVSRELTEFLTFMGAVFPDGALLTLRRSESKVIMRNRPKQLDKIERLLGPMEGDGDFYKERLQ